MVGAVTKENTELRTHREINQGPGKTRSYLIKPRAHLKTKVLKV